MMKTRMNDAFDPPPFVTTNKLHIELQELLLTQNGNFAVDLTSELIIFGSAHSVYEDMILILNLTLDIKFLFTLPIVRFVSRVWHSNVGLNGVVCSCKLYRLNDSAADICNDSDQHIEFLFKKIIISLVTKPDAHTLVNAGY